MFVVIIVVVVVWVLIRQDKESRLALLLLAGLLSTYLVSVLAYMPPITEIALGAEEELRVFSPVAYPFSVQQYRDYAVRGFRYSIVLGWPRGLPVIQFPLLHDQSEFIHGQAYYSGLIMGMLGLGIVLATVISLGLLDSHRSPPREPKLTPAYLVLVPLQIALVLLMGALGASGGTIYVAGGVIVLVVSLIPAISEMSKQEPTEEEESLKDTRYTRIRACSMGGKYPIPRGCLSSF